MGKSTLAAALAPRYARAVHIPVDDLRDMVISGRASPVAVAWTDETTLQFELARRVASRMARDYAQKGFAAIIDDVVREPDMHEFLPHLGGQRPRKVLLTAELEVIFERNRLRDNKDFDTAVLVPRISRLHQTLLEGCPPAAGWLVVDNTDRSAEDIADALVVTDQ